MAYEQKNLINEQKMRKFKVAGQIFTAKSKEDLLNSFSEWGRKAIKEGNLKVVEVEE
ncbi:hypothetical protein CCP3SC1AL1_2210003 [Gammaproteobacteria bacterium]